MRIQIKRRITDTISTEEIISLLLKDRGIKDTDAFLRPAHPRDIAFSDLFAKNKMEKVGEKLFEIREKNEMIVVYTDYDADGITGGAILWETLHLLGFRVMPYVPHRKHEGYGFSHKGIDRVKKEFDPALIISVDHGIAAADKITYAKSLGIPIVVTDHHIKSDKPPNDAFAIFHTDTLSGAGVAYFVAREIYRKSKVHKVYKGEREKEKSTLEHYFNADYLALAAVGMVADLVSLTGVARSLVKYGLAAFPTVNRVGIRHILKEAGIEGRPITPYEIGFIIAPRINAVGRIHHALDALRLLCTTKSTRAFHLANKVGDMNRARQDLVEKAIKEAHEQVTSYKLKVTNPKIFFLSSPHWHEGIIGLVAAKIAEKYYRPTIAVTIADGFAKASARSIPGFDITSFLRAHSHYLVDVGGHKAAAGFTIATDQLAAFTSAITAQADKALSDDDLVPRIAVNMTVPSSVLTISLARALDKLAPFGIGNPRPLFYSEGIVRYVSFFGKQKEHIKVFLDGCEIIFFGKRDEFYQCAHGDKVKVVFSLEINTWGGKETMRGKGVFLERLT